MKDKKLSLYKKILTLSITGITLLLSGCQSNNSVNNSNTDMVIAPSFEIDNNTVKKENVWEQRTNTIEKDVRDPEVVVGELKIENSDNSVTWELVNDSDIVYNNITFKDLYSNIKHLDLPCDETTFINFIIKTYITKENTIFTSYVNDNEYVYNPEVDGEDNVYITLDEGLQENDTYINLVNKYSNKVNWSLTVYNEEYTSVGVIYGCSDYILYNGGTDTKEIDMSKYSSSYVNSTDEEVIENTDTIEDNTETEDNLETQESEETQDIGQEENQ